MFYIGSCKEFKRRSRGHISSLRKGTHHSKKMQNCFNKYGEDSFVFEVLEVMLGSTELTRQIKEQEYLDSLWCSDIMNIRKKTDKVSYRKPVAEETRRKMAMNARTNPNVITSQFKKGHVGLKGAENPMFGKPGPTKGKSLSEEHKKKIGSANSKNTALAWKDPAYAAHMSLAHKGQHSSPQTQFKPGEARHTKSFFNICLVSPSGEVFTEVVGLGLFGTEHKINAYKLSLLLQGKISQYLGWVVNQP